MTLKEKFNDFDKIVQLQETNILGYLLNIVIIKIQIKLKI